MKSLIKQDEVEEGGRGSTVSKERAVEIVGEEEGTQECKEGAKEDQLI
jgi:hypothetical protein